LRRAVACAALVGAALAVPTAASAAGGWKAEVVVNGQHTYTEHQPPLTEGRCQREYTTDDKTEFTWDASYKLNVLRGQVSIAGANKDEGYHGEGSISNTELAGCGADASPPQLCNWTYGNPDAGNLSIIHIEPSSDRKSLTLELSQPAPQVIPGASANFDSGCTDGSFGLLSGVTTDALDIPLPKTVFTKRKTTRVKWVLGTAPLAGGFVTAVSQSGVTTRHESVTDPNALDRGKTIDEVVNESGTVAIEPTGGKRRKKR
jgi:hypothetical protein